MNAAPQRAAERSKPLPLSDLSIRHFRGLDRLVLPHLSRVNLFVGTNAAGKSSLLEAVRILATAGDPRVLRDIVQRREGVPPSVWKSDDPSAIEAALEYLFYADFQRSTNLIEVGAEGSRYALVQLSRTNSMIETVPSVEQLFTPREPVVEIWVGEHEPLAVPFRDFGSVLHWRVPESYGPVVLVGPEGLTRAQVGTMWDAVALKDDEETVLSAIRAVMPRVQRISLAADPTVVGLRHVMVRMSGTSEPRPLGVLGGGAFRFFGIALAIASARGGVLLVDEIENGIHYEAQDRLWELIFDLAERFAVQVLATTHSWDSIVGFQYAANTSPTQGMLYRLEPKESGELRAVRYSERDLAIAAEQRIEVR